jgi:hypothetical protein
VTLSTRKAWFSAPRANLSSSRVRNSGVAPAEMPDIERERAEHDEAQQRRIDEHDHHEDNAEEQVDHQRQRRAGEEVTDVLQLAHARDRIADPARLEIGDRQRQKVAEQPGAEFHVDAVRRMREQIGAQDVDDGLEHRNGDKPDDQDIERAQRPIDQDLVDDDLEEQRRNQPEQLQEERGDHDLGEQIAVLVDGAEEPGDVEAPGEVEQSGAAGHQHQAAVPHRLEFGAGHHRRTRRQRVLDQDLVLASLAENEVAPLAAHCDAGERGMDQPPPVRLIDARLELKFLPAPQHFGDADVGAEAVAYLLGVGADAMEPQ